LLVAKIILQHHERMVRSGYSKALPGNSIIIEAKILSIANAVEGIGSKIRYRTATSLKRMYPV